MGDTADLGFESQAGVWVFDLSLGKFPDWTEFRDFVNTIGAMQLDFISKRKLIF